MRSFRLRRVCGSNPHFEIIRWRNTREAESLLLLRSNPSRQHLEALYHWRGRRGYEKRKDKKTQKGRSKKKVVGFSSAGRRKSSTMETMRIDSLMLRITQKVGIVKGWEDK